MKYKNDFLIAQLRFLWTTVLLEGIPKFLAFRLIIYIKAVRLRKREGLSFTSSVSDLFFSFVEIFT